MWYDIKRWAKKSERNLNTLALGLIFFILANMALIPILLFASSAENWRGIFSALVMLGAGSVLIGMLIGFLFGIPRTLQGTSALSNEEELSKALDSRNAKKARQQYMVNTNLEQVSDWLTKIIVGVGLVQFDELRNFVSNLSATFAADMVGVQYARMVITGTIFFYLILGFFTGYIMTRVALTFAFIQATEDVEETQTAIQKLVNVDFDVHQFSSETITLLQQVIGQYEKGESFLLSDDFAQSSEQYAMLEMLKNHYFIQAHNHDDWKAGTSVELTPIAQKMLDVIKQNIAKNMEVFSE